MLFFVLFFFFHGDGRNLQKFYPVKKFLQCFVFVFFNNVEME